MLTMPTIPAIEPLLRQPAAQAVGWALLQFVWQGAAIGVLTAAALAALRRSAADVRYVVAASGLALMLTLTLATGVQKYAALLDDAVVEPASQLADFSRVAPARGSIMAPAHAGSALPSVPAATA